MFAFGFRMADRPGIAVWVSDTKQKLVSGLKNTTTVQDVIKALVPGGTPDTHGLYQTWCDTQEQLLRPRAKILRILQSLGEEDIPHVRFFIREIHREPDSDSCCSTTSLQWSSNSLQQNTIEQYSVTNGQNITRSRTSVKSIHSGTSCASLGDSHESLPSKASGASLHSWASGSSLQSRDSVASLNSQFRGLSLHSRTSGTSLHSQASGSSLRSQASDASLWSWDNGPLIQSGTSTSSLRGQESNNSRQRSLPCSSSSLHKISRSNTSSCSQNPDESSVEKLLRMMREQDAKLNKQMQQIRQIESEIEAIETRHHLSRIEEDGVNYIQQGYMLPKKNSREISVLEREIIREQEQIEHEVAEQSQEDMDPKIMEEIEKLRNAVRDSIQVSASQEQEMSKMGEALQEMQSEMETKAQHILHLVSELNECDDTEDITEDKAELTQYSMLLQHRLGENTNLVENILQRYRSNIQNIEDCVFDDAHDHSGSDSGVSSQEPESLENSSDDSQDDDQHNSLKSALKSDSSEHSSVDEGCSSEHSSESNDNFTLSKVSNALESSTESAKSTDEQLPNQSPRAPLASLDSTLLSLRSSQGSNTQEPSLLRVQSAQELSVLSDTAISKPAHQISIIQQNLTLTNETLPNDTLQPLDVLVTKETVVTSTPVPQCRATPRTKAPTPPPPPPPQRKVAFSDHDSVREITIYSMENTTLVDEHQGEWDSEEEEEENTVVEETQDGLKSQGEMPADRFVVTLHPHNLTPSASTDSENMSYQQAIYNFSPTDASQHNFLLAGPVSRLQRKIMTSKAAKTKPSEMKQKIMDKLLFLPKLASKRSKSARTGFHTRQLCTFVEDTFEDSYRYALGGLHSKGTPIRHSLSQNDVTRTDDVIDDVTLLRSYTVGDLGSLGCTWIDDHHISHINTAVLNLSRSCAKKGSLETLV